jgi:hypothetical protein
MNVDFNNLRRQACHAYDRLAEKLNDSILKGDPQYAKPNAVHHGQDIDISGHVLIDAEDIQKEMDDLRMLIGSIAGTFEEDNPNFKDIYDEVYPLNDESKRMVSFNDEEEE